MKNKKDYNELVDVKKRIIKEIHKRTKGEAPSIDIETLKESTRHFPGAGSSSMYMNELKPHLKTLVSNRWLDATGYTKEDKIRICAGEGIEEMLDGFDKEEKYAYRIKRCIYWLSKTTEEYENAKKEFLKEFDMNPRSSIEWKSETVVKAQAEYVIKKHLSENIKKMGFDKACEHMITYVLRRIVQGRSGTSTCPYKNACGDNEIEAHRTLLRDFVRNGVMDSDDERTELAW